MKTGRHPACSHLLLMVVTASLCGCATGSRPGTTSPVATNDVDRLLLAGDIEGAQARVRGLDAGSLREGALALAAGRVHLLRNDTTAAVEWLRRAIALGTDGPATQRLLAEAYRRQDRYVESAAVLRRLGDEPRARQLESFANKTPYALDVALTTPAVVAFRQTDPLPLLALAVNGREGLFLLDTGASDLILDPKFAAAVGAYDFGAVEGTFAGGRKASTGLGSVDTVRLGEVTLRNVPVRTLPTAPFGAVCGGCNVDGVLGTAVLSRFHSTIDYPAGRLVLRSHGSVAPEPVAHRVRFWLAGDHYILARGSLGAVPPLPFVVDTGLAGMAFTAPAALFAAAGLEVPAAATATGVGGGGPTGIAVVPIAELTLGEARRTDLVGVIGPFPDALETSQGVRIAGLVSHEFFRPWALSLDFSRMELTMTTSTATSTPPTQ
jgi:predicted aspartyl protease